MTPERSQPAWQVRRVPPPGVASIRARWAVPRLTRRTRGDAGGQAGRWSSWASFVQLHSSAWQPRDSDNNAFRRRDAWLAVMRAYLTAPKDSPRTSWRWADHPRITTGSIAIVPAA